jgi:hypothetical protein
VTNAHRSAVRFFWCALFAASAASIAANVAHALLNTSTGNAGIAAGAAVVPPAVLLGSTHGVSLLVRARTAGWAYWSALGMTVTLAGCAFGLSFDALRDLARRYAGYSEWASWLWPLAIDLSIAVSTLALLALTGAPQRSEPPTMLHQIDEPIVDDVAAPLPTTTKNGAPVKDGGPESQVSGRTAPRPDRRDRRVAVAGLADEPP